MTAPTFAKTHNLIAFLAKPAESEGFEQIIDFLNGSSVKTVKNEVRVQALIDAKWVNIKESSIRRTLKLDVEEGTSCLANDEIFTGLANMGYEKIFDKLTVYKAFFSTQWKFLIHCILQCLSAKTTSWNEFNSIIASAITCLAINQKFNFSRFVQLIVDHQLGDMYHHQDIYDNPSLTKKIFANMKRVGTGFSRVITPLFKNMLVLAAEEVGQAQDDVSIPTEPSTSKPHKNHKSMKQQPIAPKVPSPEPSPEHQLPLPSNDPIPTAKDSLKLQELMDLCTRLPNKVLDLESEVINIKSSFTEKIEKLKDRGRMIADIDEDLEVNLEEAQAKAYNLDLQHSKKVLSMQDIDEEEPAKMKEVLKVVTAAKLITKVVTTAEPTTTVAQVPKARKNMMIYLNNMAGFKMKFFKGMTYSEIKSLFEKHYNSNQAFLEKVEEEVTVQEKETEEEEELKRHMQIMSNDDDDVYEKATPLASKDPVVDYQIHHENNKSYYKIIKADESHKLFLGFITILKNFDREDLETLWKLKDQKGRYGLAKVKSWKLFESCRVHIITFTTTQMFLLVGKKYPLSHFTLEQMLNTVRHEVKEESEMSLELLRLVTRQLNEGYVPE
nr:hypothetical protein [Tanacetum cinerariifolium]